ncbi:hypothetical protein KEM54_006964 [Ascosphaera aggregata]|nr:hypothetical protein KEM54_006964 [Ascosphaera aggregata]
MSKAIRKGLQQLKPLRRKLTSESKDIYTGSAPLGALKLVVIAADIDSDAIDGRMILMLREEGFSVTCLPSITSCEQFVDEIERIDDELERSDFYAVVAFSRAASFALQRFEKPSWPNLRALIAYYPDQVGREGHFPDKSHVRIHLASSQTLSIDFTGSKYYCYQYPFSKVGFAEYNSETYDEIDARLAWSRTLSALRTGFDIPNYIEHVWDHYLKMDYSENTLQGALQRLSGDVYVNYIPVILGGGKCSLFLPRSIINLLTLRLRRLTGNGRKDVIAFHKEYFTHKNPSSLQMRLVSRTVGSDHIVDEVHVAFRHTQEIPWLLPNVPATGKDVEIIIISIATIHGGEITHVHTYWDQASVLTQIGLLDAKKLPVHGAQSAAKVLNEDLPFENQGA